MRRLAMLMTALTALTGCGGFPRFTPAQDCIVKLDGQSVGTTVHCEGPCSCQEATDRMALAQDLLGRFELVDNQRFAALLDGKTIWRFKAERIDEASIGGYDPATGDMAMGTSMASLTHEVLHMYDMEALHSSEDDEANHVKWHDWTNGYSSVDQRFAYDVIYLNGVD